MDTPAPRQITELFSSSGTAAMMLSTGSSLSSTTSCGASRTGRSCTSGLVHEAYLKLVGQDRATWNDRAHFLAIAATVMRRILVDYARAQKRLKRGGERRRVTLDGAMLVADQRADALLALDEALSTLGTVSERLSRVVECRFFAGLTAEETAAALQVTTRTVERDSQKACAWLYNQLQDQTA